MHRKYNIQQWADELRHESDRRRELAVNEKSEIEAAHQRGWHFALSDAARFLESKIGVVSKTKK
jgi:hypothetical protein